MIDQIINLWPLIMGVITLVIILSKMHLNITIIQDKIRTLFDLYNRDRK